MISEFANATERANEILARFGLDYLGTTDIEVLCAYDNIIIWEVETQSFEARIIKYNHRAGIIRVSCHQNEKRKRFSIAHELGHFYLHTALLYSCSSYDMINIDYKIEAEANAFAAELLIPTKEAQKFIRPKRVITAQTINEMSDRFNASRTACMIRFVTSDLIPCALICSKNGLVHWVKKSNSFPWYTIGVKKELDSGSIASELFAKNLFERKELYDPYAQVVLTESWIKDKHYESDTVNEISFAIPSQNSVVSLIWEHHN